MPGIGKYAKGKKFTLKSGNTPVFKIMGEVMPGDSPITKSPYEMNNFGVGKGTSPIDYKIKKGDTLSGIAKANNTTVEALMKANPNIKDANKIMAGADLNLGDGENDNTNANTNTNVNVDDGGGKIAPPGSARLVKDDKETKKDDIINVDEIINKPTES